MNFDIRPDRSAQHDAVVRVRAAGIRQSVNPHLLRHSFATHLLDRDANILQVQATLGHTSLRTTSNYIHLSQKQLQNMPNPLDLLVEPPGKEEDAA